MTGRMLMPAVGVAIDYVVAALILIKGIKGKTII